MPGVPLTYKTKQQILNNNDDGVESPVSKNRTRLWDIHFINAAVALDYGDFSRLMGEKRRQVEELAEQMREDDDDSDVEYEEEDDEDNSEDKNEEEETDIDEGEEEDFDEDLGGEDFDDDAFEEE